MSLRVTFLGTGGAVPTTERGPSAILVNREGDRLLFDCGEGTQRQMMRFGTGFSVSHVFLTHLHGDHVLGLPGLLQTWDFMDRTEPLSIYTPAGTADDLTQLLYATQGRPSFGTRIHEVHPGDVAVRREDYDIRTFRTAHDTTAVGYALVENDRKGRFDRERAEELGVPAGPLFSQLHEGDPVELDDGTRVAPEQVVGPPRPGRTVVYTGDTRPTDETVDVATGADLLIHDGTFTEEMADRARETAHATAREAGRIGAAAGVDRLVLTHISSRYSGDPANHRAEASDAFGGEVRVANDGDVIEVPFPDA